ncbi:MAG: hypothetical protein R2734_04000 [Nocardioides sp.]
MVLWLFGQHDFALLDTELWLDFIADEVSTSKLTVAVTRLEEGGRSLDDFREVVAHKDPAIPLVAADPGDRTHVVDVLATALRIERPVEEVVG